ncbi:hypothetical protein DMC01_12455 [Campylobacter troglodytis]|nr:hypothetical protein DMC01_12455 [Campylobacter troglodytis]
MSQILYLCWLAFWIFWWFVFLAIAHSPDILGEFLKFVGIGIAPLWVYNLWNWGIKRERKYLRNFLIFALYYPLALILYLVIV